MIWDPAERVICSSSAMEYGAESVETDIELLAFDEPMVVIDGVKVGVV